MGQESSHGVVAPTDKQLAAAKALDDAFRTQLTRASFGMSPIALALAYADWAMHLSASPGHPHRSYQMQTAEAGQGRVEPDAWVAPPKIDPNRVLCNAPGPYVMVRYAD